MMKKVFVLFLLALASLFFIRVASAQEKIKIGALLYSQQQHYQTAYKGIIDELKLNGFDENRLDIDYRNAEGSKEKVLEITNEFKSKRLDLIIVVGTPAFVVIAKEIKDIPIVFAMVFDPISSGAALSWESSGNNTTGTSTWVNMDSLVRVLRRISPAKRVGVIYSQKEENTIAQLNELTKIQSRMRFKVIPGDLTQAEDAAVVTDSLIKQGVDAIFVTGGTIVGNGLPTILKIAKFAKIVTVSHLTERAAQGVLLVVAADSFQLGRLAGKKIAMVLKGVKPAYIPIEYLEQYDITINKKTADEMSMNIPETLLATAAKVIE